MQDPNYQKRPTGEQQVEQALQPTLATHYMYHFFCAHLMANHHQAHEDALVLYERLAEPLPDQPLFQSSHLKSQMGMVHYHMREFEQAMAWFDRIQDPFYLEQKDVYSNISDIDHLLRHQHDINTVCFVCIRCLNFNGHQSVFRIST